MVAVSARAVAIAAAAAVTTVQAAAAASGVRCGDRGSGGAHQKDVLREAAMDGSAADSSISLTSIAPSSRVETPINRA
eukprot:130020-Pleurochrysis_carterae.AAC.1